MSRKATVQECDQAMTELLPDLPRPEQKELAALVTGVVLKETCVLSKAAAAVPGDACDASKMRRAQRLLANERLDVPRAQRRLLARILLHCQGHLHLLVDGTTTGATSGQQGTATLMLALAWHRRALPVLWHTWRADQRDQGWAACLRDLVSTLAALLPAGIAVTVLADRGLTGPPVFLAVTEQGWHDLLRVRSSGLVRVPDGGVLPLAALVPRPGCRRTVPGALIWPTAPSSHQRGSPPDWTRACRTTITAIWRVGDADRWLLLSDWPPGRQRCTEDRRRTWEEELFRDLKGMGWHWEHSRVRAPTRVERLLLVLALATLWVLCLGGQVVRGALRPLVEAPGHAYSRFPLGLRWAARLVANDHTVHCTFHLKGVCAT